MVWYKSFVNIIKRKGRLSLGAREGPRSLLKAHRHCELDISVSISISPSHFLDCWPKGRDSAGGHNRHPVLQQYGVWEGKGGQSGEKQHFPHTRQEEIRSRRNSERRHESTNETQ
ncbi:hypothetical protein PoB_006473300 [Plakobranchus ocellatus]|uniref:Uncharacterized protein n=1 Tax=Plakobranchus ocellatus TaxID=259542 RepID=A0AAV4D2E7_9GAST|nr:hypothetical protein PoB_006473300 [Plakobranchus ocellatus]